jgi:hypothetical protein
MQVSEKTLELNVGAELLDQMRNGLGMTKAYLRGLTQKEEKQEGADFILRLGLEARFFAFQFKAPKGKSDGNPYQYTIQREQHEALFALAQLASNSVFYVFPHYVTTNKLWQNLPKLMIDTWLLGVEQMLPGAVFGNLKSKTVRCDGTRASVNPEYGMHRVEDAALRAAVIRGGVRAPDFQQWYSRFRASAPVGGTSPWLRRGLRIVVVSP